MSLVYVLLVWSFFWYIIDNKTDDSVSERLSDSNNEMVFCSSKYVYDKTDHLDVLCRLLLLDSVIDA